MICSYCREWDQGSLVNIGLGHRLCWLCHRDMVDKQIELETVHLLCELRALREAVGYSAEASQRTASYTHDLSQMQRRRDGVY